MRKMAVFILCLILFVSGGCKQNENTSHNEGEFMYTFSPNIPDDFEPAQHWGEDVINLDFILSYDKNLDQ